MSILQKEVQFHYINNGTSSSLMQLFSLMAGAPLDAGLVGNPNDYVFSQNALDNIITQLMEQTSG